MDAAVRAQIVEQIERALEGGPLVVVGTVIEGGEPEVATAGDKLLVQQDARGDISTVGSQTEKAAAQAEKYLQRVVAEHPGTPWAQIAAVELGRPLGYAWQEAHTGVNTPKNDGGGGNGRQSDDMRRKLAPPKPKRPLKNL